MKNRIIFFLIFILFISCSINKTTNVTTKSDYEYFKVEVEQDGKIVKEKDRIIFLNKKPFKFIVNLYKTKGVDVSASYDRFYFDYSKNLYKCDYPNQDPLKE